MAVRAPGRWADPPPLWNVRGGRVVGDPAPTTPEAEARIIRRLNELEESNGRKRYPDTGWAYKKPPVPPED